MGPLRPCWRECVLAQPHGRQFGHICQIINAQLFHPTVPLLGICPIQWLGYVWNDICTRLFTAVWRMMVKYWKYHKRSSIGYELDQRLANCNLLPVYVNEVLLEHSLAHSFPYRLCFTLPLQSWIVVTVTCKAENIYSLVLYRKFAFPWVRRLCVHVVQHEAAVKQKELLYIQIRNKLWDTYTEKVRFRRVYVVLIIIIFSSC